MNICCLLQGSALMYFSGSDESDLDGIIDLGLVQKVSGAVCAIIISCKLLSLCLSNNYHPSMPSEIETYAE